MLPKMMYNKFAIQFCLHESVVVTSIGETHSHIRAMRRVPAGNIVGTSAGSVSSECREHSSKTNDSGCSTVGLETALC